MSDPYQANGAKESTRYRPGELRERMQSGHTTLGCWAAIPSPFSTELLATMGFDWITVDMQHGLADYATMVGAMQALRAHGIPGLVRVPSNDPGLVGRVLDAGAIGVVVPMVNTPAAAEAAVRACRYPPLGTRSWGPARAALGRPEYGPELANDETICVVMLENPEAAAQADAILSVPGVDAVYIGPWDLSLTVTGEKPSPGSSERELELIGAVRDAAERAAWSPGSPAGAWPT
jgi:4-hydroxy-2-oxoheptanedioate aldolase